MDNNHDNETITELCRDRKKGIWYRFTPEGASDSIGKQWHGLIKFGNEKKLIIDLYGGGVSINEETAAAGWKFYSTTFAGNDEAQFYGITSDDEDNPFKDHTCVNIPYCTGDFHIGTKDFEYTGEDGKKHILRHHGYTNFRLAMEHLKKYIGQPDEVIVAGYSAGAFGAAFLAEEIFAEYFPDAANRIALIDSAILIGDNWKKIASDVWGAPEHIYNRFTGNDPVLDSLRSLSENVRGAKILYSCSVRDGVFSAYQNYVDTGMLDADETTGGIFEKNLKETVGELMKLPNASVFIWNDRESDTALTSHTLIMDRFTETFGGISIADWLSDAVNGKTVSYGLDLF
ncbi:MAG: pectin acetylesterase [Clostridia bacterium]|nr:pectin acetylesterase [Clostridia bacterium]